MSKHDKVDGERLGDLLSSELKLYEELLELVKRQDAFIASGDTTSLMPILASKQEIIGKVTAIEEELKPFKAEWTAMASELGPQKREQISNLIDQVKAVLGEIVEREKASQQAVDTAKKDVLDRMTKLKDLGRAAKAYGGRKPADGTRFIDKKR